ncbi:MAG TPA: cobalamin-dependent protein [Steroidobacteraceae bacterium]|nr:cobalamin-dependent protein [Steroidobacteraceae bacterium]
MNAPQAAAHPIRVVLGKVGLDLHDWGAKFVARGLREAGMEVIYLGPFQTAATIVGASTTEDPDVVAVSNISGEYMQHVPELMAKLREHGLSPVVLVGGLVPAKDKDRLLALGVDAVFGQGSSMGEIVKFIQEAVNDRAVARR